MPFPEWYVEAMKLWESRGYGYVVVSSGSPGILIWRKAYSDGLSPLEAVEVFRNAIQAHEEKGRSNGNIGKINN